MTRPRSRALEGLLFLLVFTVPLRSLALFELPGANLRVPDLVVIAGAVVLLAGWLLRGGGLRRSALDGWLWLFVAYVAVSVLWSLDPAFGAVRTFKFARSLVFFLLVRQVLERDYLRGTRIIAAGFAASFGFILPVLAHTFSANNTLDLQALANVQLASSGALDVLRTGALGAGTFAGTVNTLAMWANVGMFVLLGTGWWRSRGRLPRLGFWAALVTMVGVQVVTLSRGAWLGMAVGGLWWLWRLRGSLRFSGWVYVAAVLVLGLTGRWLSGQGLDRLIVARLESTTEVEADGSITQRFTFWQGALRAFAARPLGGVGMGGGTVVAARNGYKDWFVHNVYLQILYELGLVGLLLWAMIVARWLGRTFGVPLAGYDWDTMVQLASLQAVSLSLLTMGLTNLDFTEFEFWIVLAMAAARPAARQAPAAARARSAAPGAAGLPSAAPRPA